MEIKCTRCKKTKLDEEFSFKNKEKGLKKSTCKICDVSIRKTHYTNNKKKICETSNTYNEVVRVRNRQFIWDYLKKHPCINCGETNPIVLEFDHRDDTEKKYTISYMTHNCHSITKISEEIEKCDIRCGNCHKIRTADQFNYYDGIIK